MTEIDPNMTIAHLILQVKTTCPNGYFHILTDHGCVVLAPDEAPALIAMTPADADRAKTLGHEACIEQATPKALIEFPGGFEEAADAEERMTAWWPDRQPRCLCCGCLLSALTIE